MEPIRTIFVPAGNGGVAAGTVYGNYLLGLPFKVVVISTEYAEADLKVEMMKIIREAEAILGVEFKSSLDDVCLITDDYCGGGWSINTPESEEAVYHLAQKEGIFLENVYTSKTFVGYCDLIKKGRLWLAVCPVSIRSSDRLPQASAEAIFSASTNADAISVHIDLSL